MNLSQHQCQFVQVVSAHSQPWIFSCCFFPSLFFKLAYSLHSSSPPHTHIIQTSELKPFQISPEMPQKYCLWASLARGTIGISQSGHRSHAEIAAWRKVMEWKIFKNKCFSIWVMLMPPEIPIMGTEEGIASLRKDHRFVLESRSVGLEFAEYPLL